jgi:methyl-accepting chemotaxis protein
VRGTTAYEEGSRSIQAEVGARFGDMEKAIAELSEGLERSGGILRDALRNQAALVLSMTESVEAMNRRVVSIKASTAGSEELAAHLSGIALESSGVIDQARTAIAKIEESSGFIRGVLDSINDISEQTSVLSINAAIEAARAGESGKGFTIVASSIRGLATKTKETVDSSLGNLSRMNELLATTGQLSESVSTVLGTIVEESGQTASKVKEASRDVDAQEGEFAAIMESTKRMAADQETIRVLSERDMEEKRSHLEILSSLKEGLLSISARINEQRTEGERLRAVAAELEAIMAESSSSVATLESILSVSKA